MSEEEQGLTKGREKEWDKKVFDVAYGKVCERYPELKEKIAISLETPQIGKDKGSHHNEGPKMEAHLSLILKTVMDVRDGHFHESLQSQDLRDIISSVIIRKDEGVNEQSAINPAIVDYTFFHDIAKPDSLTLKFKDEKKGVEITWEQWQEIEKNGEPYTFEGKEINSTSYFHQSEGPTGQHGNKGVEMLKDAGVPPEILIAIGKHEVAYQFAKINTAIYEEHFVKPGFSEDQQKFILAGSYVDTMASLSPDGTPDMGNYANLVKSRENYLLIKKYIDTGAAFRENDLKALKGKDMVLTAEDIEKIIQREKKYNLSVLGGLLDELVSGGQISADEKEGILSVVTSTPNELGKKFGPKMKILKPLLEKAVE